MVTQLGMVEEFWSNISYQYNWERENQSQGLCEEKIWAEVIVFLVLRNI